MTIQKTGGTRDELPEQLIENIVTLPTIPPVLAELNSAIADPNSSGADIARIISRDPSTATKVLRVANSAYYGLRNKVTTINHAVTMLGFKIIRNMVMTATVFGGSSSSDIGGLFNTESFWRHSLGAGIAAQVISREVLRLDKRNDDFFICGLLHDLGKIIFAQSLQDRFQQTLQMSLDKAIPLFEAEKQIIGCTHAEVGGLLAKRWNLSQEVIAALQFHHLPLRAPEEFKKHALVAHYADFLVRKKGVGSGGGSNPGLDQAAQAALKLSEEGTQAILSEMDKVLQRQDLESLSSEST